MQAIVMAAGEGLRLYPFTTNKPKAMVRISRSPPLEHLFSEISKVKPTVKEIILITGYKEEVIKKYFGDSYGGIKIKYVTQKKRLGTGHAVSQAEPYIKGKKSFLVINGDDLYSAIDLQQLTKYDNCILLQEKEDVTAFGVVTVDSKGKVTGFVEKPKGEAPSNLINVGAYSFTKELFTILNKLKPSPRGEIELTDAVLKLAKKRKMHHVKVKGYWSPVGYPWHILDATRSALKHNTEMKYAGEVKAGAMVEHEVSIDTGSVIKKGARIVGLVSIGKNVIVEEGASIIGPTAIANNTKIGKNTIVDKSVIGKNTTIQSNCHIHHSVLGDNVIIKEGITTEYNNPKTTIKVLVKKKKVDTKLNQLGCFVADCVAVSEDTKPGQIITQNS